MADLCKVGFISAECRGAGTLENSDPAFWAAQVSKVPPEISRLRPQDSKVRGGFLQSAHFAEMRGGCFRKNRVFVKMPASIHKNARAADLRDDVRY